jgi:hypothetical protein
VRDFLPKIELRNLVFREYLTKGRNFSQINENLLFGW